MLNRLTLNTCTLTSPRPLGCPEPPVQIYSLSYPLDHYFTTSLSSNIQHLILSFIHFTDKIEKSQKINTHALTKIPTTKYYKVPSTPFAVLCIYRVLLPSTYNKCPVQGPKTNPNCGALEFTFSHWLKVMVVWAFKNHPFYSIGSYSLA